MYKFAYTRSVIQPRRRLLLLLLAVIGAGMLSGCGSGILAGNNSQLVQAVIRVTLSPDPVTAGQPVSIQASVIAVGSMPTGTVQFFDNEVALGNRSLNDHGEALLTIAAISAGTHGFIARYDGSTGYGAAESAVVALIVPGAPVIEKTIIGVAVNPTFALTGQQVAITGTVTSAAMVPTSTVGIYDGQDLLGTSVLNNRGEFTLIASTSLPGIHQISARYSGDTSHAPSVSSIATLAITPSPASTSISLSATPNRTKAGEPIALVATITSASSVPSGLIHFYDGTSELASQPISTNGLATLNQAFSAGVHSINAVYDGSADFQPSRSSTLLLNLGTDAPGEQAFQADAFVDSIGVNTHLSYTDTPYFSRWQDVLTKLQRSGIRHIRDGFYNWTNEPFIAEHRTLASAGIRCDYIIPLNSTTTGSIIASFAERVKDMEAVEGPNECDAGSNCGGGGANGVKSGVAFMKTVHEAGTTLHIPVIGPSFTLAGSYAAAGNLSSSIDYNNLHVYFGGRNPGSQGWGDSDNQGHSYGSFEWWKDQAQLDAPGLPLMVTEAGYISPSAPQAYTIPESLGASYVPRLLLLAFNKGVKRSYIYELLDEVSSPGYGLLRSDLSEKPAFTALATLIAELNDSGTPFVPAVLEYSITGGDSSLAHTLLQKRDGSFILVLWSETSNYDVTKMTSLPDKEQTITVSVTGPQNLEEVDHIDITGSLSRAAVSGQQSNVTVDGKIALVRIR